MSTIEWHSVSEWLKTTVPGIITLGTIGSVIAVLLLKVAAVVWKRAFGAALERFFLWNFRPFSFAALITYRYAAEGRWADLSIYATSLFTSAAAFLVLFGVSLIATIAVAVQLGVKAPSLLATLVVFTGVTFILLLREVMSVAGLWSVRFQREHVALRNLLKNKQAFFDLTDQIFKNLQAPPPSPEGPPTPDPSPAAATPGAQQPAPPATSPPRT
jgi:hypothetical protein